LVEKEFIENHQVLFCKTDEFQKFVDEANVKPEEAKKIMHNFAEKNGYKIKPHLFYFIIEGHYVFTSYFQPKIPEVGITGIWVNANTGKAKEVKEGRPIMAYDEYEWSN